MRSPRKPEYVSASDLKRLIPNVAAVARDLYGINFTKGVARCPFPHNHCHGDRDPSLRFDKRKNRLFCASQECFGEKGVDAIGLVQHMDRCSFSEARQKLTDQYGIQNRGNRQNSPRHDVTHRRNTLEENSQGEQPILASAESVRQGLSRQGFRAVAEFEYRADLRKVRFEHESARQAEKDRPEKTFRWEHFVDELWLSGDGGIPKPMYVNREFQERDQAGLAVGFEGEGKADLAGEFGLAAFSFKNITLEQVSTLVDCDVVIWPDNDASGKRQAHDAAGLILRAGIARSVKLIKPPPEFTPAADIIDVVRDLNWNRQQIAQLVDSAAPYSDKDSADFISEPDGQVREHTSAEPENASVGSITTRRLSDIQAKPVDWLWPGRIARGKLTIIAGDPGLGKSQITASIATIVTTGGRWPVDRQQSDQGDVLFLSAEDDAADTLRPRLEAAGADLTRIHIVDAVVAGFTGNGTRSERFFSLEQDVHSLGVKLDELGNVAVVVIDPITAYLGNTDSHKNADVRRVLAPLSELASRHNVAIIGISHLTKAAGPQALMRVTGSLAFVAAARAAYLVMADPKTTTRRLFLPMKNNLGPDVTGLAFSIEGATVESSAGPLVTSLVLWEAEPVEMTADEAMRAARASGSSALDNAKQWLHENLADGPMPAEEVLDRAIADGITKKTLYRASKVIDIRKAKLDMKRGWEWSLPPKMAKTTEDGQTSSLATFGEVGHVREADGACGVSRTDVCARCGPTRWEWDGSAWVCTACRTPHGKSGSDYAGISEVDSGATNEQPMSPTEVGK